MDLRKKSNETFDGNGNEKQKRQMIIIQKAYNCHFECANSHSRRHFEMNHILVGIFLKLSKSIDQNYIHCMCPEDSMCQTVELISKM